MVSLAQIEKYFFEAMLEGWVSDKAKEEDAGLPGQRGFRHCDPRGLFTLTDAYFANPENGRSSGTTTIWHESQAVWVMHYQGFHEERVIQYVKSVLLYAYQNRDFHGGRGQPDHMGGELWYHNAIDPGSSFAQFSGREKVYQVDGHDTLGSYRYFGMSLI